MDDPTSTIAATHCSSWRYAAADGSSSRQNARCAAKRRCVRGKKNEECGSSCWAEAQRHECVLWEAGSQQQNKPAAAKMVDGGDEPWLLL